MRCIRVCRFGGPEVLQLHTDVPIPTPKDNQVVVQVKVAGVNPVDTYIRSGTYARKPTLPYTPGGDGSGVVHAVGAKVTRFHAGQRVWFGMSLSGSYAEYCLCDENRVGMLPDDVSFEHGAMLAVPYCTAYRALVQKAGVRAGETVLVHGATGGVGTAAVQMCKVLGVDVIATAGSPIGEQLLKDMGVVRVYNHRSDDYVDAIKRDNPQIDVILEMLANVNLEKDLEMIGQNGRVVVIGSRGSVTINPRLTLGKESCVIGCALGSTTPEECSAQMKFIEANLQNGVLLPVLAKMFQLGDASEAHREIIDKVVTKGQIVLRIGS